MDIHWKRIDPQSMRVDSKRAAGWRHPTAQRGAMRGMRGGKRGARGGRARGRAASQQERTASTLPRAATASWGPRAVAFSTSLAALAAPIFPVSVVTPASLPAPVSVTRPRAVLIFAPPLLAGGRGALADWRLLSAWLLTVWDGGCAPTILFRLFARRPLGPRQRGLLLDAIFRFLSCGVVGVVRQRIGKRGWRGWFPRRGLVYRLVRHQKTSGRRARALKDSWTWSSRS